jgi:hypothetical protein
LVHLKCVHFLGTWMIHVVLCSKLWHSYLVKPVTVAERSVLSSLARKPGLWVRIPQNAWMFGICMCLFCVCVALCLGRELATGWSLVQGVLPSVKMIMKLKNQRPGPKGAVEPVKKKMIKFYYLWSTLYKMQMRIYFNNNPGGEILKLSWAPTASIQIKFWL